jgi:hypothetical protein
VLRAIPSRHRVLLVVVLDVATIFGKLPYAIGYLASDANVPATNTTMTISLQILYLSSDIFSFLFMVWM